MTVDLEERAASADLALNISPTVIDAGILVTWKASVNCTPETDLSGRVLHIIDEAGDEKAAITLTDFDGQASTGFGGIKAPDAPGQYIWTARLDHGSKAESVCESDTTLVFDLAFEVCAHRMDVIAWGAPTAIAHGSNFEMLVGLRCSAGCDLSGRDIEIQDQDGQHLATVKTGATPRTGTVALYWAEVALVAPEAEGRYRWRAVSNGDGLACNHETGEMSFTVNAVPLGMHKLRVEVRDSETGAPIPRAKVVAHPYRALSDADGAAELLLPPGKCRLVVSGPDHFPIQVEGDMNGDKAIEAVLNRDVPLAEADIWT